MSKKMPSGKLGFKDKIIRALVLRIVRGKLEDLRGKDRETTMGKILKALDGWKLVIGIAVLFSVSVYDSYHNGHTGDFVGSVLVALGWMPPGEWTGEAMTKAVAGTVALIGFLHKFVKAVQQVRAGSTVAGALSEEGYVASAVLKVTENKSQAAEAAKDVRES